MVTNSSVRSLIFMCMYSGRVIGVNEVEIFEVNGAVACTLGRDDTVEVELDRDHVNSGRSPVSGDIESVTADGELQAIGGHPFWDDSLHRCVHI